MQGFRMEECLQAHHVVFQENLKEKEVKQTAQPIVFLLLQFAQLPFHSDSVVMKDSITFFSYF